MGALVRQGCAAMYRMGLGVSMALFGGGSGGFECWVGDNRSPFLAYYLMHHHHSKNNYFLSLPLRIIITTIQHGTFS